MFVCYLDDSYADQATYMTMAGYVATRDAWRAFEAEIEPIFVRYGVTVLHALDFHGTRGEFRGWTAVKKNTFVDEVYDVAARWIRFGISRRIHRQTYRQRQDDTGLNKSMSALGVAFSSIWTAVTLQTSVSEEIRRSGLSFVIEAGNNNETEILNFYNKLKSHEMFAGSAMGMSFVPKHDSRAVQLADFLAFYSRREADREARFDGRIWLPREKIYRRFYRRLSHSCLTANEPYVSRIENWRDIQFNGQTNADRPFASERPVIRKRQRPRPPR